MTLFLLPEAEHADEVLFIQYTLTAKGSQNLSVGVPTPVGKVSKAIRLLLKLYVGYSVINIQALPVGSAGSPSTGSTQQQNYN